MARNSCEITQIMKRLEKIQARIDGSDKRMEAMAIGFQDCNKESYGKETNDEEEREDMRENLKPAKKGEEKKRTFHM